MAGAIGTLGKLGIDSASPVTKRFDFISEGLILDEEFPDANGLRGTLSHDASRVRQGIRRVHGPIVMEPDAVELANLLQWILGGTPSGSPTVTYPLADTLISMFVAIDRNDGSGNPLFTYNGVAVDNAVFRGNQGMPLELSLDLVGIDESKSGTFPAISIDTANTPWMFHDLVLVVGGNTLKARSMEIHVANHIDRERFFNTQTLTLAQKLDRTVTFACSVPLGDSVTSYGTGIGGVTVTATFTNGGAILAFSIVNTKLRRVSPSNGGRFEIMLPLAGPCYKSGATLELVTTLNPGP